VLNLASHHEYASPA